MKSLQQYITDLENNGAGVIQESIVGKGYAISQNRAHGASKNKLQSIASKIQSEARKGISEDDPEKRQQIVFTLFIELGNALKVLAEMSRNTINVSTAGVLDQESIKKALEPITRKATRR
ncbi:MAG: hypothetical protein ACOX2O_08740 [Bdellovibrionota bacterium]|jgi:hypothetical protein